MSFPRGWNNPAHEQLREIVKSMGRTDSAEIIGIVDRLLTARIAADYGVSRSISAVTGGTSP